MNITNLMKLADHMENNASPRFNMGNWETCLVKEVNRMMPDEWRSPAAAAEFLGLVDTTFTVDSNGLKFKGNELFVPYIQFNCVPIFGEGGKNIEKRQYLNDAITPAVAARCIRNLIITGKVDWELALKPNEINTALPPFVSVEEYQNRPTSRRSLHRLVDTFFNR